MLTRSKDHDVDERCHMQHIGSRPTPKFLPMRTAMMGAQMIHVHPLHSLSTVGIQFTRDHRNDYMEK